jgi:hypothetical protein
MKTFSLKLYMYIFFVCIIINTLLLKDWRASEIVIESTILAYIMQKFLYEYFQQNK